MITANLLTALELYQNSEIMYNASGLDGEIDTVNYAFYWDFLPNQNITLQFTANSNIQELKGLKFLDKLSYATQGQENAQIGIIEYNNYYIYDFTYCYFYQGTCYTWTNNISTIDYIKLYENQWYNNIAVTPLFERQITLNTTRNINYYPYSSNYIDSTNTVQPNTLFNMYNYTQNGTTFISALQGKYTWNITSSTGEQLHISGVNQKNILTNYYLNQVATHGNISNQDTFFINNTLNFRAVTDWTCPDNGAGFYRDVYRAKLLPIGIKKATVQRYIELENNSNAPYNALRLLDTTITNANNLYLAPYLSVSIIVLGLIGIGLFKLIKGLFT